MTRDFNLFSTLTLCGDNVDDWRMNVINFKCCNHVECSNKLQNVTRRGLRFHIPHLLALCIQSCIAVLIRISFEYNFKFNKKNSISSCFHFFCLRILHSTSSYDSSSTSIYITRGGFLIFFNNNTRMKWEKMRMNEREN